MIDERERQWPEPTPEALLAALRQAGWLLEQETATALTRAGFEVTQSWPYQDPDAPDKSREMDVVATKRVHLNAELNFSVIAHVVVECKESAMPYALIGRTTPVGPFAYERKETQFLFDRIEYDERPSAQGLTHEYVGPSQYLELHHLTANPWARDFEATLLVRLDKKGKDDWSASNDGLMQQAMVPVAKVIDTLRTERATKNDTRANRIDATDGGRHHAQIALYFPLIVTSAPLFRVDATQEPPQVSKSPWVPLRRTFNSATLKGEYRATVVNADALDDYIESQILGFANAVGSVAKANPQRFLRYKDHSWAKDAPPTAQVPTTPGRATSDTR